MDAGVSEWLVSRTGEKITGKDTWYHTKRSSVGVLKSHRSAGDCLLGGRDFPTFKPVCYHVSFTLRKKMSHGVIILPIICVIIFLLQLKASAKKRRMCLTAILHTRRLRH